MVRRPRAAGREHRRLARESHRLRHGPGCAGHARRPRHLAAADARPVALPGGSGPPGRRPGGGADHRPAAARDPVRDDRQRRIGVHRGGAADGAAGHRGALPRSAGGHDRGAVGGGDRAVRAGGGRDRHDRHPAGQPAASQPGADARAWGHRLAAAWHAAVGGAAAGCATGTDRLGHRHADPARPAEPGLGGPGVARLPGRRLRAGDRHLARCAAAVRRQRP